MKYLFAITTDKENKYVWGSGENLGKCKKNAMFALKIRELKRVGKFNPTDISIKIKNEWSRI